MSLAAPEMTDDGIEYLAGWMAYVYRTIYPQFNAGHPSTCTVRTPQVSWIQELTYGGLLTPTKNFLLFIKKINRYVGNYLF